VTAIAAVSAISGAVVALELMAPAQREAAAVAAAPMQAPMHTAAVATPAPPAAAPAGAARVVTPRAPEIARTSVENRSEHTAAIVAPAVPAPQAAPAAAEATVAVPDSELTFAKGYSLRRAAREATVAQTKTAEIKTGETKVVAVNQFGRAQLVIKRRPKEPRDNLVAQNNGGQDNRRAGWHDPFSFFDRTDGPGHNQAMAYGDQRPTRRAPQQQGSSSGGGLFGDLF
jgi:hypothetical protein